ncbi:cation:proton antiporter regulatory subunit [Mycobacterium sp. MYCO198283]|uniref:cation:proton antiporter regulatory subunit n=1 Tax=Mycobacterium sp. MYCO198283 TaxID=2883505 RepID=UPI001E5F1AA9|nr:cation:proton antiporter regulatory subunit [Mycobacterium sp. MYCO198283]MCG5433175.1 cation:proton antiporter regulatory subunit [Mycobacterium sp. MYCO198283]
MEVNETLLPGVGLRFEFDTRDGVRMAVIARRSGDFELVVYADDDPDRARDVYRLTNDEAEALAQILGAPRIAERFADLTREVPGLDAGQIAVRPGSRYADRPLGDTRARTRTGASIVAIVRDDEVLASPGPQELLRGGDVLVVIGTQDGIAGVAALVDDAEPVSPPGRS